MCTPVFPERYIIDTKKPRCEKTSGVEFTITHQKDKTMSKDKIPFDYEKYLTEKYEVICRDEEYKVDDQK